MTERKALIVVDVQNDFCPGGALPVNDGDKIVAPINKLIAAFRNAAQPVILTRDWHPNKHTSFKEQGGRWPPHCVQHSRGAMFHPSLNVPDDAIVISKATSREEEGYSGFQGTDLAKRLRRLEATELFVCGLATDYCVKNTVIDALDLGFRTSVLADCIKGVNLEKEDSREALRQMVAKGALMTRSARLLKELGRRVAVSSSS